jgi:hypothetical protein
VIARQSVIDMGFVDIKHAAFSAKQDVQSSDGMMPT